MVPTLKSRVMAVTKVFVSAELWWVPAMAQVHTRGANSLTYRYQVGGSGRCPFFLGILSGDRSLFRTQQTIEPGQSHRDQVTTRVDDVSVYLVISTSAATVGS